MKARTLQIVVIFTCAAVLVLLGVLTASGVLFREPGDARCFIHDRFQVYCLSCGGTRSFHALMHGRVLESFRDLPAVPIGLGIALYLTVRALVSVIRREPRVFYGNRWILIGFLTVWVGFGIVRDVLLVFFHTDLLGDFIVRTIP